MAEVTTSPVGGDRRGGPAWPPPRPTGWLELLVTNTTALAGGAQPRHRVGRAGDRVVGEPDHAVEVECEGHRPQPARLGPWPDSNPSPASATTWRASTSPGDRPALRRHRRRRSAPRWPPATRTTRSASTCPSEADGDDALRRSPATCSPSWLADGTLVVDERPSFTALPHDVHRRGRRRAAHHRRHRRARAQPARHGHPPPRAHHQEGQERPARPAAGVPSQPLGDLGPLARQGPHRPAPGRTSAPLADVVDDDGVRHTVWRVDDPATVRRHLRRGRRAAGRDRRRPPPLRDLASPTSASGRRPTATPARPAPRSPRRRAGRGRAHRAADPPAPVGPARRHRPRRGARAVVRGRPVRRRPTADHRRHGRRRLPRARAPRPRGAAPPAARRAGRRTRPRLQPPRRRPRRAPRRTTSRFQHGVDNVRAAVASGAAQAGVLLRPATVAQIEATAHGGERMPPKTTFFHPKPKTGLVFRSLG